MGAGERTAAMGAAAHRHNRTLFTLPMFSDKDMTNHTGRELELMLAGTKPLAMFYDDNGEPDERIIPEKEFDGYVRSGLFVKGTRVFDLAIDPRTGRPVQVRYVLYALKAEAWRVNALFLVLKTQLKLRHGPDEAIERMTSNLLGYSDEEFEKHFGDYFAKLIPSKGT
jgi:hypothetical protein